MPEFFNRKKNKEFWLEIDNFEIKKISKTFTVINKKINFKALYQKVKGNSTK